MISVLVESGSLGRWEALQPITGCGSSTRLGCVWRGGYRDGGGGLRRPWVWEGAWGLRIEWEGDGVVVSLALGGR